MIQSYCNESLAVMIQSYCNESLAVMIQSYGDFPGKLLHHFQMTAKTSAMSGQEGR